LDKTKDVPLKTKASQKRPEKRHSVFIACLPEKVLKIALFGQK
jgi:hypothetical protein